MVYDFLTLSCAFRPRGPVGTGPLLGRLTFKLMLSWEEALTGICLWLFPGPQ